MSDDNPYAGPQYSGAAPELKRRSSRLASVLTIVGIFAVLAALLLPNLNRNSRPAARRSQCTNNLHQIAIALHNYADVYHSLPPAYTVDASGKPLHSWRTLILPFMENEPLYKTIDLTKPWNDPVNAAALNTQLRVYQCPEFNGPANHTTYLAVAAPGGCFRPAVGTKFSEITDGVSETLMVIEVDGKQSVPWMAPNDADLAMILGLGPKSQLPHQGGFEAALCNASVRHFSGDMAAANRHAMITIAGGDKFEE